MEEGGVSLLCRWGVMCRCRAMAHWAEVSLFCNAALVAILRKKCALCSRARRLRPSAAITGSHLAALRWGRGRAVLHYITLAPSVHPAATCASACRDGQTARVGACEA